MFETKYFDYLDQHVVDIEADGCDLKEWDDQYGKARFAIHPDGFRIFLPPSRIIHCDEYLETDPYAAEQNQNSDNQNNRIKLTIKMIQIATSASQDALKILDIGCGQGFISSAIQKAFITSEVSGLDYSKTAIEYAHKHFPEVDFIVGDAYSAPYTKEYFDVVVCNNLWEHVPDPLNLLAKISKILKPNGSIILSTPSRYRIRNLIRIIFGKPVNIISSHHVTEYSIGQVFEQLTYGGFQVIKYENIPVPMRNLQGLIAQQLFSVWISLVKSHHLLDGTVFYLGRKFKP